MVYRKQRREITKKQFFAQLKRRDGNFQNLVFNFSLSLNKYKKIDFDIKFNNSIFNEDVSFSKINFLGQVVLNHTVFKKDCNFYNATFEKRFFARKVVFESRANFGLAHFNSDVDFSKAIFFENAYFKKVRFLKNVFFHKTFFYKKIDFSYSHFPEGFFTSFLSINKAFYPKSSTIEAPSFIFRNIFFPKKAIFNDVDLSKTIFKHSFIENITFKNCSFLSIQNRAVFYPEVAKTIEILVADDFRELHQNLINTVLLPYSEKFVDVNISDKLKFINENNLEESETYFVVTQFQAKNFTDMKKFLQEVDNKSSLVDNGSIFCKKCISSKDKEHPVIAFRIKRYNSEKSWAILEDSYRQLKKSLEDSHDWQAASSFYRSEMNAKMNLLKINKEQWWYRQMLSFYKIVSGFGECVPRVLYMMLISIVVGVMVLKFFAPIVPLDKILAQNISYFLPVFGNNTTPISALHLKAWQNIFVYLEIIWFYILWLNLAIAIRRKLRR